MLENLSRVRRKRAAACRDEARARGLKRYSTGEPCKRGHVAERYVSSNECVECNGSYYVRRPGARRRVGITQIQNEALTFLTDYQNTNGHSPSYDEIAKALGLKSKAGVTRIVKGLVERGAITYLPNRWRSILVVDAVHNTERRPL